MSPNLRKSFPIAFSLLFVVHFGISCNYVSTALAKGGTEFKVQVESNEGNRGDTVDRTIKVIQNKLVSIGLRGEAVKDPESPSGMIVRVYGSGDMERAKKFLFTAYQLELRKVVSPSNPSPIKTYPTMEEAKLAAKDDNDVLVYQKRDDSKVQQYVIVEKDVIVNGDDVRDAQAISRTGSDLDYQISFTLKREAAAKFGDWTGRNINNYLAIVLDKQIQSAAYIKSQIFDSGEISGRFSKAEAEDIVMSLKSGYLPATIKIIEEKRFES